MNQNDWNAVARYVDEQIRQGFLRYQRGSGGTPTQANGIAPAHTHAHTDLTAVTSDEHHAKLHADSHADGQSDELALDNLAGVLEQARTHENPDTDSGETALHHTLGVGANQAAAGDHTHAQPTWAIREMPAGVVDGVNATFTLEHAPNLNSESVFKNGVLLEPGEGNDYTIAAEVITMLTLTIAGDIVRVSYMY